ncbi:addiction module antidote protein, HigA family [Cognatiyoonia koreensis]|uniref:Addiction module antidote protein, HigA family n=1 Tax=Cognatiyoonia koreensis TaxID=364200 RepID=A0A1I0RTU6_9RHOB|nr:HigA family addiction module antitoxin [Cognatiyoonia koreensis]SEW44747.1 addiction module antidote protein, HigA family [Cognatiyoonia koreensis]
MSLIERPMHPGEVLKELHLEYLDMGAIAFARHLRVPRTRIERLIKGTTRITPDMALRLARAFNTTPAYWMNLQTNYDMAQAVKDVDLSNIEPLVAAELPHRPKV